MAGLKSQMVPLVVLDEFKSAGVFVNWWQQIRYDLKTIVSTGWHHSLIPDEYLIEEFFKAEAGEIETLEAAISEAQGELAEVVEAAQEVAAYEPEEGDDKVTAAVMKKALKSLIDDLKESRSDLAKKEMQQLRDQDKIIKDIEKRIKEAKTAHKEKKEKLEHKLQLKRLGGDGFKAGSLAMIKQADAQITKLDPVNKEDKKKIKAINKDKEILKGRISKTNALLAQIGGQLSEEEARRIILKKLYSIAHVELERYLNAEKRGLIQGIENLWDKYAVSSRELEAERESTLKSLDGFMKGLRYI
jgi:type I restriction enzyme M protein